MAEVHEVSVEIGGAEIVFETGRLAKQASGAVLVASGDTRVLGTATAGNIRDIDFMPLTVDIEERMYAAGKIPGSFFKREGRAGEKATLIARMIDRPLRPLFPKGWRYETQLVSIPLSIDHERPYDILAMNGASAALMVSNIPFPTPVGAVRIGKVDGNFVVNPSEEQQLTADLDLVVAGTDEAILMVEAGANEITEAEMLDALDIAHGAIKKLCAAQLELAGKVSKPKLEVTAPAVDEDLYAQIQASHGAALDEATSVQDKLARQDATKAVEEAVLTQYSGEPTSETYAEYRSRAQLAFDKLEKNLIRQRIAVHKKRPDGRSEAEIRRDRHRGRHPAAHARLRAVHARPDAGAVGRRARHDARGDAPGQPRARDVQALLPPLQLPAVLGGRGRLHARPEAPRHRPRRARRARAGPDDPVAGGLPLHDPRRVGHPRVQRLLVDGVGVRLLAVADGRGRAAEVPGRRCGHGPHQGGRRLHRPHRHRRRRGPPRRHGLQGRRHGERDHRAPDGHQDHRRHLRDPARRAHAGARGPAVHPRQDGRVDAVAAHRAVGVRSAHLVDLDRPGQDRPADRQGRRDHPRPLRRVRGADRRRGRRHRPRLRPDRRAGRRPGRPDPVDDQGGRGRRRVRHRQGRQDDDVRRVRGARQGHRRPAAHLQRLARPAGRDGRGGAQQGRRDLRPRRRGRQGARPHRPAPRRGPGDRRQVGRGARDRRRRRRGRRRPRRPRTAPRPGPAPRRRRRAGATAAAATGSGARAATATPSGTESPLCPSTGSPRWTRGCGSSRST